MPVISHKELEKHLQDRGDVPFFPVYLIYGEDLLTKGAFDVLLNALLPASERSINYEPLDGTHENIHEVIGRVNTFSLLPGTKVIALRESKIFYARQDKDQLLDNAKKAFEDDNVKKAARVRNLEKALKADGVQMPAKPGSNLTGSEPVMRVCLNAFLIIGDRSSRTTSPIHYA